MHNLIFTTHIQVDSKKTAELLAVALAEVVGVAAAATVEASDDEDAQIRLGEATLRTHSGEFVPNA